MLDLDWFFVLLFYFAFNISPSLSPQGEFLTSPCDMITKKLYEYDKNLNYTFCNPIDIVLSHTCAIGNHKNQHALLNRFVRDVFHKTFDNYSYFLLRHIHLSYHTIYWARTKQYYIIAYLAIVMLGLCFLC